MYHIPWRARETCDLCAFICSGEKDESDDRIVKQTSRIQNLPRPFSAMLVLVFCCIAEGEDGYNISLLIFDKEKALGVPRKYVER